MQFCLLGPLLVRADGANLPIPEGNQQVVLTALLLNANTPVSADVLIELIWPARQPASARATLQNYVKRLRHAIGDAAHTRIVTQPHGYLIRVERGELDIAIFETLIADARSAADADAWGTVARHVRAALGMWRGDPLAGLTCDDLLAAEASRLNEMRLQALELRIEADLRQGRHAIVIAELRKLAAAHPLRERFHHQLMLALYRCGRRAEALAAYENARLALDEHLGALPGSDLRHLLTEILAANEPRVARGGHAKPQLVPRQLPPAVRNFVGRQAEQKILDDLLGRARASRDSAPIVVITGTAGIGKTALAVYWGQRAADQFPGGQLYVNLRGFDPSGVPASPETVLRDFVVAQGFQPRQIPAGVNALTGLYRSLLADKAMLIVLDNAYDADQVRPLLPASPNSMLVITSRGRLTGLIAAEGAHLLQLAVFTPSVAAEMLSDRVGADRVGAEKGPADELGGLCSGLPLGISIVAARAVARPEATLAEQVTELRQSHCMVEMLGTGEDATSLRPVLDWSYRRLTTPAARVLRLLGLHPGADCSRPAAASLTGIPEDRLNPLLDELIEASLADVAPSGRLSCHDLVRAYAADCAFANDSEQDRHDALHRLLVWYLQTASMAARTITPGRRHVTVDGTGCHEAEMSFASYQEALSWLDGEYANLIAAVRCAGLRGEHEIAWKLPIALWDVFSLRAHWSDQITADEAGLASARQLGDKVAEGWLLNQVATAYMEAGRAEQAIASCTKAVQIRQALGDRRGEAAALNNLGRTYSETGMLAESLDCLAGALAIFRELSQPAEQGTCLFNISAAERRLGRPQQAAASARKAASILAGCGLLREEAGALTQLALALLALADPGAATAAATRASQLAQKAGDGPAEAEALIVLGDALHASGQPAQALQRWNEAYALLGDIDQARAQEVLGRIRQKQPGLSVH